MIKTGIIGFGKMGQIRARSIHETGRGQVLMVSDEVYPDPMPGPYRQSTHEEIIEDPDLDAIFICTPNYLNMPLTIRALRAGKHVFCEKPPAFTGADMQRIRAVEGETGLRLMYGFNHRHHESIQNMKELIDSGVSGKILWMRGRYGKSSDDALFENWRADIEKAGGGILLDQGIHMLDLFLYLAGDFDEVKAFVSNLYWKLDIEDNVFAIMRNSETNVVASLHSTMTQWRHLFSLEVFCEKGYFVLNGLKTSSQTYGEEVLSIARDRSQAPAATWADEEKITYHTDDSWGSEVREFFDAIEEDRGVRIGDSADALKLMTLIDLIYAQR